MRWRLYLAEGIAGGALDFRRRPGGPEDSSIISPDVTPTTVSHAVFSSASRRLGWSFRIGRRLSQAPASFRASRIGQLSERASSTPTI